MDVYKWQNVFNNNIIFFLWSFKLEIIISLFPPFFFKIEFQEKID